MAISVPSNFTRIIRKDCAFRNNCETDYLLQTFAGGDTCYGVCFFEEEKAYCTMSAERVVSASAINGITKKYVFFYADSVLVHLRHEDVLIAVENSAIHTVAEFCKKYRIRPD